MKMVRASLRGEKPGFRGGSHGGKGRLLCSEKDGWFADHGEAYTELGGKTTLPHWPRSFERVFRHHVWKFSGVNTAEDEDLWCSHPPSHSVLYLTFNTIIQSSTVCVPPSSSSPLNYQIEDGSICVLELRYEHCSWPSILLMTIQLHWTKGLCILIQSLLNLLGGEERALISLFSGHRDGCLLYLGTTTRNTNYMPHKITLQTQPLYTSLIFETCPTVPLGRDT